MRKVYIAGPMRGYPQFNFPAFKQAAVSLSMRGFHPISPAEMDELFDGGWPNDMEVTEDVKRKCMRRDLVAILDLSPANGDAIYLLKGWEKSKGANAELAVAVFLGLEVMHEEVVN